MQCPVDGSTLQMMDRQGVEIDYCPQCRGVWLDRGELDKIIDRSAPPVPLQEPARAETRGEGPERRSDDSYRHEKPYRKRKSFLGEIFDFD